ncbi:MAG: 2,3-bisphosphoglycerate-independent phosphoglycerate mutase [Planctomycetota bacterium]|nr:2,3-bisphosphoglycerate-independent phosphoglycerate mutase [Planctomycetota bacterium]
MVSPLALIILDGFGEAAASPSNAVTLAEPRFLLDLRQQYPTTFLDCSGEKVGLPCGLMGNSEVGHLNIGAGRIVWQEITRIDKSVEDGSFSRNPALVGAIAAARESAGTLHLLGLCSDGRVHSSDRHLEAILRMCHSEGLRDQQVVLHAFLDGRDTPPRSALQYLGEIERVMSELGLGRIATVCGRYFAMDRDKRWDRTRQAYDALVRGTGACHATVQDAIQVSYAAGKGDEFVEPVIIGEAAAGRIRDGDGAIFFNFRTDRTRQLTEALTFEDFEAFDRPVRPAVHMATMTRYREDFTCPVAFAPSYLKGILPQVVSEAGMSQLRIAETEKYAHVTFFMSGGDEKEFPGEQRILVPSPKVATYDLKPEMSADLVTDKLLEAMDQSPPDLTILNFANADMVGHTGSIEACIEAVRTIDRCLSRIVPRYLELGGHVGITADHGNCEMMVDPETGNTHTAHTVNPVPFIVAGPEVRGKHMSSGGRLCDIATTLLPLLGLPAHPTMEGANLL